IKVFEEDPSVKILKGRWGPYIVVGRQNVRIPKGTEASTLTLEDCLQLAQQQEPPAKTKKGAQAKAESADAAAAKKSAARKTPAKKTATKAATKKAAAKKTAAKSPKK
ncbi:MAG: topoisomerase C-terminal repeat-containing protein, partial [Bacteroidota bacterium]